MERWCADAESHTERENLRLFAKQPYKRNLHSAKETYILRWCTNGERQRERENILVGFLKIWAKFEKEPYKRDLYTAKETYILRWYRWRRAERERGKCGYRVATMSKLLKNIGLFCRI